jgi:hypothetical protein
VVVEVVCPIDGYEFCVVCNQDNEDISAAKTTRTLLSNGDKGTQRFWKSYPSRRMALRLT